MLSEPYTIFAAVIGSTFLTMATHGTDQDMVQRMLTAPDPRRSRLSLILSGLADIPIALAFLSIGILLWLYYNGTGGGLPDIPDNHVFAHFIVNGLPAGVRGLIIAGVFATMMGSASAALNALATSFTADFYLPYVNPGADDRTSVRAARIATLVFGVFMVLVGTLAAYSVIRDRHLTIIPIAIGILGYTYGALLGIFLLGMLTSGRGDDRTNTAAMTGGIVAVLFLGKVRLPGIVDFGRWMPSWWPEVAWPWYVMIGCVATLILALPFRTCGTTSETADGQADSSPGNKNNLLGDFLFFLLEGSWRAVPLLIFPRIFHALNSSLRSLSNPALRLPTLSGKSSVRSSAPRVSADSFDRWFSSVSLVSATTDTVTLAVPNPIHQFFIESNYSDLLPRPFARSADPPSPCASSPCRRVTPSPAIRTPSPTDTQRARRRPGHPPPENRPSPPPRPRLRG